MSFIRFMTGSAKKWASTLTDAEIGGLLTTLHSACAPLRLSASSTRIGQQGELSVRSILEKKYTILPTNKTKRSGDMMISIDGVKILIEVKKWKAAITSAQINKFYRDLSANPSVSCGLLVSLDSRIAHTTNSMEHKTCVLPTKQVPVVLLSLENKCAEEYIHSAIDILVSRTRVKIHADPAIQLDLVSSCLHDMDEMQTDIQKKARQIEKNLIAATIHIQNSIESKNNDSDI